MTNNSNIEEQFKNAFEHFEADVNPQVWTSIEQSFPGAPTQVVDASSIAKGVVGSSKLTLLTIGVAATLIVGMIAVNYLITNNSKSETVVNTSISAEKTVETPLLTHKEDVIHSTVNTPLTKGEEKVSGATLAQNQKAIKSTLSDKQNVVNSNIAPANPPVDIKDNEVASNTVSTDNKNTDPVISISSADEKHENISSPAVDTENFNTSKSNTNESFDWGVIPNAFSPNADGKNDVFKITNPNIETIKVTIMDRNGKQVHEWTGINGFWDGKDINGNDLPKGVYYYFIFATSTEGEAWKTKGTITLLR